MTEMRPIRAASLLERAAQAYDFGSVFQPAVPAADEPAPLPVMRDVDSDADVRTDPVPPMRPDPEQLAEFADAEWFDEAAEFVFEPAISPANHDFDLAVDHSPIGAALPEPATVSEPAAMAQPAGAPGVAMVDRDLLAAQGLLVPGAPVGALAEEFRLIKRQLLNTARAIRSVEGDRARMILVCSANPDEGKTYCAINLALSLAAERETEVLLVDADFAKPDVPGKLGVAGGVGLLDALARPGADIEDYVVATDVPQLSLLPAGTPSIQDTELLASDRTRALLDALMANDPRRIIIFDSPPALVASPAATLAHHVGQVMLVVRADRTSDNDLRQAVGLLDGCEHIQLVLNAVSFAPGSRRFGSYYGMDVPA